MYEEMLNEDVFPLNFIKEEIVIEESEELGVVRQEIKQDLEMGYNGENCSEIFKTEGNLEEHNLKMHSTNDKLPSELGGNHLNGDHQFKKHGDKRSIKWDQCNKVFQKKMALWKYKSAVHFSESPFQCNVCLKTFMSSYLLKRHSVKHSEERPHKCGQCSVAFKYKSSLNHHVLRKHEKAGNFPCSVCGKTFLHISRLICHSVRHSEKKRHICDDCGSCFKSKGNLARHIKYIHAKWSIQCDACPKKFATLKYLHRHVLRVHGESGESSFKCGLCLKIFSTNDYLSKHLKTRHSEERLHKCDQCCKMFKDQRALKIHIVLMHVEGEKFPCGVCGRIFINKSRLDHHSTTHKDVGQHVCDVCGTAFKEKEDLTRHKNYVHTKKSIQCVCPKKFETLKYLQKQKPFKCDLCSEAFKCLRALSGHKLRKHGTNGQIECVICGKKFTLLTSLEQHYFTHSDETHFKCDQCDKTYKTEMNLAVHKSYAHVPEIPSSCEWCLESFETITFLQQHRSQQKEKWLSNETEHKEHLEEHVSKYYGDNTKTNLDNDENGSFGFGIPSNHFQLKTSLNKHLEVVHIGEVKVEPIVLYDPEAKQEVLDEIKEEMDLDVEQEPRDFDQS